MQVISTGPQALVTRPAITVQQDTTASEALQ